MSLEDIRVPCDVFLSSDQHGSIGETTVVLKNVGPNELSSSLVLEIIHSEYGSYLDTERKSIDATGLMEETATPLRKIRVRIRIM
jgi:hypothetical protein